jgi:hypothetical protein
VVPPFVFLPGAANMLREKTVHIERLAQEVATKDGWIAQQQAAHAELLRRHQELEQELLKSNHWAADLGSQLEAAGRRIVVLQDEAAAMATGYEAQIAELQSELAQRTRWAQEMEAELRRQTDELARCVEALHQTESELEERTRWAMSLNEQRLQLEALVAAARASRWVRLGRAAGLGPELRTP